MENESRSLTGTGRECSRAGATNIHDLADDLLELVLLRLSSPISLVRAAGACKLWRRLIAGDGFLRRFRSLHAPFVLGHYTPGIAWSVFVPAPPPSPWDAAILIDIRDRMNLGFLDGKASNYEYLSDLFLTDCRDGLLAFVRCDYKVVVCNPWTKQYKVLPCSKPKRLRSHGAFLVDADDETGMSNFRVIRVGILKANGRVTADVSVISATDKRWLSLTRTVLDDDIGFEAMCIGSDTSKVCVGRVAGYIFLSLECLYLIQINERTGVLSSFYIPEPDEIDWNKCRYDRQKLRVVGRDTRTLRLVRIVCKDLRVLQLVHGGKCVEEKKVNLSQLCNIEAGQEWSSWHFPELGEAEAPGCVMLSPDENCDWMFSVDVESMEVVCMPKRKFHDRLLFPYELPWPPTMKACL